MPVVAEQLVAAAEAVQDVVAGSADEDVVDGTARQGVAGLAAEDPLDRLIDRVTLPGLAVVAVAGSRWSR